MKKSALLALFFCVPFFVVSQNSNYNLSSSIGWDGEPFLAINPANSSNIVVAWMSPQLVLPIRISIELKSSHDGGQTWSSSYFMPHPGSTWHSADVSMAFSSNGDLYLSYIDYRENPDSGGVYVAKSTDGGLSFSAPVQAISITEDPAKLPLDRPWIAIDNSATTSNGTLYLTSKPPSWIPAPNRPYYKVSTDGGATWSSFHYADTAGFTSTVIQAPMPVPAVGIDGAMYIVYPAVVSALPKFVLAKSTDQGQTLQHSLITTAILSSDTNIKQGWHLCTDPVNANNLFLIWEDARQGDADVYGIASHDGGQSWGSIVRINDDAVANGVLQDMVWAAFSHTGKLITAWRDRRNAPGTGFAQPFEVYAAVSTDAGNTFSANFKMSDLVGAYDSLLANDGNDFLGLDAVTDTFHLAWSDFRSGELEVYATWFDSQIMLSTPVVEQSTFEIYPVPCNEVLHVMNLNHDGTNFTLELYDAVGRQVKSVENGILIGKSYSINVSKIPPGIYYLQIHSNAGVSTRKVPIVR
jgi:hypothetical protein